MKKFFFITISMICFAAVAARVSSTDEAEEYAEFVPMGEPVFPADMIVALWDDKDPICYQHRDTIAGPDGTGYYFNQLDFRPDGDDGIIMTWYATVYFTNGFTGDCTYIYTGTRDVNMVNLTTRRFDDDESEEGIEILDPTYQATVVDLFSPTQLRFNDRTFDRVRLSTSGK